MLIRVSPMLVDPINSHIAQPSTSFGCTPHDTPTVVADPSLQNVYDSLSEFVNSSLEEFTNSTYYFDIVSYKDSMGLF